MILMINYCIFIHGLNISYWKLDSRISSFVEGLMHRWLDTTYYINILLGTILYCVN